MDKKPISKETLEEIKARARLNLSNSSSLKDQVEDNQLLEKEDIEKIGQLKKAGKRHSEISEEMGVSMVVVKEILKTHFPLQQGVTRFPFKKKAKPND